MLEKPEQAGQKLTAALSENRGRFTGFIRKKLAGMDGQDPEDVLSDVVLTLLEKGDLLAEVENMTAYLFSALSNRVVDLFRRKRPETSLSEEETELPLPPLRGLEPPELREDLQKALSLLSSAERAVWLAVELEGWTFAELANLWSVPIGTLLSRKSRAGRVLKKALQE